MLGRISLPILDLFLLVFGAILGSLALAVYLDQHHLHLLLFIIGSFLLVPTVLIKSIINFRSPKAISIVGHFITSCFHIATGILLIIDLIDQKIVPKPHSQPQHWRTIIPILFILNVIVVALSSVFTVLQYIYTQDTTEDEDLENSVDISHDQKDVLSVKNEPEYTIKKKVSDLTLMDTHTQTITNEEEFSSHNIDEEPSELAYYIKTSVENQDSDNQYLAYSNQNWMDSTGQFSTLKLEPENISNQSSYSDLTTRSRRGTFKMFSNPRSNWSIDGTERRGSVGPGSIYKETADLRRRGSEQDLRGSRSSKSFIAMKDAGRPDPRRSFTNREPDIKTFKSVPNFIRSNANSRESNDIIIEQESSMEQAGSFENLQTLPRSGNSKGSLLTVITDESRDKNPGNSFEVSNEPVKRSKSTSWIGKKNQRREQKWKSINDEKVFLSNVNESLLPPVLKKGESPIMELKRQQELFVSSQSASSSPTYSTQRKATPQPPKPYAQITSRASQSTLSDSISSNQSSKEEYLPPTRDALALSNQHSQDTLIHESQQQESPLPSPPITSEKFSHLSPVGEVEIASIDNDDFDEENLPHINEFGEPVESVDFSGFDQDYVVVPTKQKKRGKYQFQDVDYGREAYNKYLITEADQEGTDPNSLHGLERIPNPSAKRTVSWLSGSIEENSQPGINSISLKEWDQNSHLYAQNRSRSGINLNYAGINRLVSDHNLRAMDENKEGNNNFQSSEFLLPPIENRVDRLDNLSDLSDIQSAQSIKYGASNRSFSAPSLHTFRNLSENSMKQSFMDQNENSKLHEEVLQNESDLTLTQYRTPPDFAATTNSSPIKKFFQESPKRLSSVFRKKSINQRMSIDLENHNSHKHSSSTVSNQISISSLVSSRSGSPRKSIKSLLTNRSHKHSSSIPSVSKPVAAKPVFKGFSAQTSPAMNYVEEAIDFWDLDTNPDSDKSRISSIPSVVIGEYDKEKWRTLKALENERRMREAAEERKEVV